MVPQHHRHKHFAKHYLLCFGLIANYLRHLLLGISWEFANPENGHSYAGVGEELLCLKSWKQPSQVMAISKIC